MKTITEKASANYRQKGSKFIGYLLPAADIKEFKGQLEQLEKEYHDATHHCYAWRLNPHNIQDFAQDDGEPGGTAGLPILNRLRSYSMVNCACVVVRYYGGTNLGKPGLIEAYGHTAKLCLMKAALATLVRTVNYEIRYPYQEQKQIDRLKNSFDLKELQAQYLEQVTLKIACRAEQAPAFGEALDKLEHYGIETTELGNGYIHMLSD